MPMILINITYICVYIGLFITCSVIHYVHERASKVRTETPESHSEAGSRPPWCVSAVFCFIGIRQAASVTETRQACGATLTGFSLCCSLYWSVGTTKGIGIASPIECAWIPGLRIRTRCMASEPCGCSSSSSLAGSTGIASCRSTSLGSSALHRHGSRLSCARGTIEESLQPSWIRSVARASSCGTPQRAGRQSLSGSLCSPR